MDQRVICLHSPSQKVALGDSLEMITRECLDTHIPRFEGLSYQKRNKSDGFADFCILENGAEIMDIEVKNWGDGKCQDSWIKNEIIARFKNTPKNSAKILLGHINLVEIQKQEIRRNGILFHQLKGQVFSDYALGLFNKKISYDTAELEHDINQDINSQILLAILLRTGKYHPCDCQRIFMNIVGDNEVIFDPRISNDIHCNLKGKHTVRTGSFGHFTVDYVKVGFSPLDVALWIYGHNGINALFVPKTFGVESDHVDFAVAEIVTNEDGIVPCLMGENKQLGGIFEKTKFNCLERGLADFMIRVGVDFEYGYSSTPQLRRSHKAYGLKSRSAAFWKCIYWKRTQ